MNVESIEISNERLVSSLKSDTYVVNAAVSKGRISYTLFSSTDTAWHKNARKAMNSYFTRTAVMTYETFVERTIELFITKIDNCFVNKSGVQGIIDVPTWLTYFTFDVMSDLTYSKHHGFISRGEDAYGIINWVKTFLDYGFIVRDSMFMPSKAFKLILTGGSNALDESSPETQSHFAMAGKTRLVQW